MIIIIFNLRLKKKNNNNNISKQKINLKKADILFKLPNLINIRK